MSTEIIASPDLIPNVKRIVADALARQAEVAVPYFPSAGRKLSNRDILATVLWDIITQGAAYLADGTPIKPESYSDWLSTVKFVTAHLDGPVAGEDGSGTNVFKVYVGVKIDQV